MVLQKKLDYGFNGYQVPRASRSARGRDCRRKKVEDSQMCSFELLAAVAGKLLLERESSHAPTNTLTAKDQHDTVEQEQQDEENPCKVEPCDQGSCGGSVFVSVRGSQDHKQNYFLKEFSHVQNVAGLGCLEKFGCAEKLVHGKTKNEFEIFPCIVEGGSSGYGGSCEGQIEDGAERNPKAEVWKVGNVPDTCNLEDPMELDMKPSALVSSDNSVEVPLCRDHVPLDSFPRHRDEVKVVSRDDDVNFSECTQPSNITMKASRSPPPIGDRRIRMMSASKYWRVAPKLKDGELSNTDKEMKHVYHKRKICNTHQRYQRNSSSKKRKLFDQSLVSTSDEGVNSEGISNSAIKGINGDTSGTESGASSFTAGRQASIQSRDSHVKLSIKSFCVPELFIEIPETATLGSLKRTVMEAVTAILGGGLHVGVLLQGKKVRDDNKTLLQTGISKEDKLSSLGFMLEPNKTNAPSPLCSGDPSFRLHSDTIQLLTRYSTTTDSDPGTSVASPKPSMINLGNCVESDHDSVPSPPSHISMDKTTPDSRALVAVPAMDVEALALVTFNRKSRQTELVQRRIRRPFSVSEVEALVEAVEKIGTGRWRDVKLLAFDNAKHRTYVDLKDKWKTLVHTARISPQQRRGEPVPQELLDRVLSAHAYWSHGAVTDVPSLNICKP